MTEKQRRMFGWMKASCVWSIVTGVCALILVVVAGSHVWYFEESMWVYVGILALAVFGGMQVIDGLVRMDYSNRILWALEDKVEPIGITEVTAESAKIHGRIK